MKFEHVIKLELKFAGSNPELHAWAPLDGSQRQSKALLVPKAATPQRYHSIILGVSANLPHDFTWSAAEGACVPIASLVGKLLAHLCLLTAPIWVKWPSWLLRAQVRQRLPNWVAPGHAHWHHFPFSTQGSCLVMPQGGYAFAGTRFPPNLTLFACSCGLLSPFLLLEF